MRRLVALATTALLVGAAVPAAAHVDVLPREVTQGEAVEFTVRVPTERSSPTVAVRVDFPPQITVYSFAPPPAGWTIRPVLGPDQRFSRVIYRGGQVPLGQYIDFRMLGTPFESGTALWKTRQTAADGVVKPWTGPPEEEGAAVEESGPTDPGPGSVVMIAAPGATVGEGATTTPVSNGATATDSDSGAAIWLGVIAIAISAMALLALGFLWSTRPARLPGGDEGA